MAILSARTLVFPDAETYGTFVFRLLAGKIKGKTL